MSRETYDYKRRAIKAAKELYYPEEIISRLQYATMCLTLLHISKIFSK